MKTLSIPTFVINLKKRADRKENVLKEFSNKDEFSLTIVEAIEHTFGAIGLWHTIRRIVTDLTKEEDEFIILCEDDVQFTVNYSRENLMEAIRKAGDSEADVLLGGVSWFASAIQISENLFWVESFTGLQFTVIFRKFFKIIQDAPPETFIAADYKLSLLTENIIFMHPFIATQKEFGYSDATPNNNQEGRVTTLFDDAVERIMLLGDVKNSYQQVKEVAVQDTEEESLKNISIPTYVINLPERTERLEHIKQQFEDKKEFDVIVVEACKHEIGSYGLWQSIRKVIQMAIVNDDDVIIICEDDHQFTEHYSREYLLKNIIEAHEQGAGYLSGGTAKFDRVVPVTENRYWVNHCLSAQFIVLYKKLFNYILEEPFDEKVIADMLYSEMTSNKMILYPFISTQKKFGYSDVTALHNEDNDIIERLFAQSNGRLNLIRRAYRKYKFPGYTGITA